MPYQDCDCHQCVEGRRTNQPDLPVIQFNVLGQEVEPAPQVRRSFQCEECWTRGRSTPTTLANGRMICENCARYAVACDICDGLAVNTSSTIDGESACNQCVRNWRRCGQCSRQAPPGSLTDIDGYSVCPGCTRDLSRCSLCARGTFRLYRLLGTMNRGCRDCVIQLNRCSCCSNYAPTNADLTTLANGNEVCHACMASYYRDCRTCGRQRHRDYSCSYCNRDPREFIRSYGYKPTPNFHQAEGEATKAYFGVEIEVDETNFECAELVAGALGPLGYMKYDSSVSSGFEIVTHPMTHQYARESFPWEMLEQLAENGAEASDSCGIHVHVSRDGFSSKAHQYRWLKLIYRNENGVTGIARRRHSSWAHFTDSARRAAKNVVKADGERSFRNAEGDLISLSNDRYEAVNIWNKATFEVRVFASSLERREVQAAIDLVAASVEYTRNLTVPTIIAGGWGWDAFRAWVAERPEYTALNEEMAVCAS
jgi:hypothetical protein